MRLTISLCLHLLDFVAFVHHVHVGLLVVLGVLCIRVVIGTLTHAAHVVL